VGRKPFVVKLFHSFSILSGAVLFAGALVPSRVSSLPAHRSIFQAKAGYPANCSVCHNARDERLTSYGREFLHQGRSRAALDVMDVMDPDQDGFASAVEIKAKSNPGNPRSTPDHPGSWLADIKPTPAPKNLISDVFGHDWACDVVEKPLSYEGVNRAERALKLPLHDEDVFPTVFIVREKSSSAEPGKVLGRAVYSSFGKDGVSVFFVVMSPGRALRAVRGVKLLGDQRLMKPDYLKQFEGKTVDQLSAVDSPEGTEADNAAVLTAVRRGVAVIEAATGVTPP
jgi:hypothetical protein